jgi:hypothetical protein
MDKVGAWVFLLAFLVDFLLLRGAAQDDRRAIYRIRAGISALIGAGYHLLAMRREFMCLLLPVLLVMAWIAFGTANLHSWGKFLFMWLVCNAMAAGAAEPDFWFLILAAALLCLLVLQKPDIGTGRGIVPITIRHGGKVAQMQALRDNGNLLTDPVTGESVLIVSPWVGWKLLGLTAKELMHPVETLESEQLTGLRLIPYTAVGQKGGLLLAMRFDDVLLDGRKRAQIVAFSPNPIGDGRQFEALAGGIV